jgi:hypothetical protein
MLTAMVLTAQQKAGVRGADDLRKWRLRLICFAGNRPRYSCAIGFGTADGQLVRAGLVDTSGYAADVQARCQGVFDHGSETEHRGSELNPGQYGFGFSKEGKFLVMDVGDNDLFTASGTVDDKQAHPVPLKIVQEGDCYRLYAGRKWVGLKTR